MGIALPLIVALFSPLQSLADRWMPVRGRSRSPDTPEPRHAGIRPGCASHQKPSARADTAAGNRPLRVIRTVDAQQPRRLPAKVVISGRMADVCAELERLAALEATETALHRRTHMN
jgi:hypothetical protein